MSTPPEIYVGITGHRKLASPVKVLDAILREGESLLQRYGTICGLTPLAEGADRLFAEAMIRLGIPYQAVLPLTIDNYQHDFPSSVKEFQYYLDCAQSVSTLPHCPWLTPADIQPQGQGRNFQYLSVGIYLVNQCEVLLSVWDRQPSRGLGGTAQITALYENFSKLKQSVTEGQYNYFLQLGQRNIAIKQLITIDAE